MGWETRQRGGRYYYKPARINGQPRRLYLGAGPVAAAHEVLDRRQRREREATRVRREAAAAQAAVADAEWRALWQSAKVLAAAVLVGAGYYYHRGQLRPAVERPRTRHTKPPPPPPDPADPKAVLAYLAARANAGEPGALGELRRFLDDHPEAWRAIGDLTARSIAGWSAVLAGENLLDREAITRAVGEWGDQLAGPAATPVERALADVAKVARLHLNAAELTAAGGAPAAVRRLDAAAHRLTATLKLLGQVQAARRDDRVPAAQAGAAAAGPKLYAPPDRAARTA